MAPWLSTVPSLENYRPQPPDFSGEGEKMKHSKNFSACEALLKKLQALNKGKPEAWSKLERARRKLNRLKPNGAISQKELFEVVREVAEAILKSTDRDA
jgi:hypothetical protein